MGQCTDQAQWNLGAFLWLEGWETAKWGVEGEERSAMMKWEKVRGTKREEETEWKLKGQRPINLSTSSSSRPSLKTFYFLPLPLLLCSIFPFPSHSHSISTIIFILHLHICFTASTGLLSLYFSGLCACVWVSTVWYSGQKWSLVCVITSVWVIQLSIKHTLMNSFFKKAAGKLINKLYRLTCNTYSSMF